MIKLRVSKYFTGNSIDIFSHMRIFVIIIYSKLVKDFLLSLCFRGRRLQMFFKIGVLINFAIFTGKQLCRSFFLVKLILEASKRVYEVMFFDVQKYVYSESVLNAFAQNKRYRKRLVFSFASSNSSQFLPLIYNSYMSWIARFVSLKLCVGFPLQFHFFFIIKIYIFFSKMSRLFDSKTSQFVSKLK